MVEFEIGRAVVAGLVGGTVMLVMLYAGIAMMPSQMRMNLLLLLGGMMGLTGAPAYLVGLMMHAVASAVFGAIHAGVFAAADIDENVLLWGLLFGVVHAAASGMALGMMPAVHPLIRSRQMAAPGVLAMRLGAATSMGFVVLHLLFGAVVAVVYAGN